MRPSVLVTGAAGFLGSRTVLELAREAHVTGLDIRPPSPALRATAPEVRWLACDIGEAEAVRTAFRAAGRLDFVVHLAAFYHFDTDWRPEYVRVNLDGTRHILETAAAGGVKRVVFASTLGALHPPPEGEFLTERSPALATHPYGRSKAEGERICAEFAARIPVCALRIGGIFSDWCELPPLWSLMKLWGAGGLTGRVVPGQGKSGFPYLHRDDFARLAARILERHEALARGETLFACSAHATTHADLFGLIHANGARSWHVPKRLAKWGVAAQCALGRLSGRMPMERAWMVERFVDRVFACDTRHTQRVLDWSPAPELAIERRMPVLMAAFRTQRKEWEARNLLRNAARYEYYGPEGGAYENSYRRSRFDSDALPS